MELTRRQFLGKTATAVIVAGTMASGKVFGANDRIRMCTIGFHGQGGSHIKDILGMKDQAEYVALCDVDANTLEAEHQKHPKANAYKDFRKMLDKEGRSIDACIVTIPDFMHATAALACMQLGKHVYVQ